MFATKSAAIATADELLATDIDWNLFFADRRPASVLTAFGGIHEKADAEGRFLKDLTAPAGVIPAGVTLLVGEGKDRT